MVQLVTGPDEQPVYSIWQQQHVRIAGMYRPRRLSLAVWFCIPENVEHKLPLRDSERNRESSSSKWDVSTAKEVWFRLCLSKKEEH
jgi:hypothetical protein